MSLCLSLRAPITPSASPTDDRNACMKSFNSKTPHCLHIQTHIHSSSSARRNAKGSSKMRASTTSTSSFVPTHRYTTAGSSTPTVVSRTVGGPRASLFAGGTRRRRRVALNDAPPPGNMMMMMMSSARRRLVTTTAWMTHRDGGGLYRGGTVGRATRAWTVHAVGDATEVRTRARFFFYGIVFSLLFLLLMTTTRWMESRWTDERR